MQAIYKLYWSTDPDNVYVGKTVSVSDRYADHCSKLRCKTHYNNKLQDQYNNTGLLPEIAVLEYCEDRDVFKVENKWIVSCNSVASGFNLIGDGNTFNTNKTVLQPDIDKTLVKKAKITLIGPNSEVYYVNNIAKFCREHPVLTATAVCAASEFSKLQRQVKVGSYKGFRVYIEGESIPLTKAEKLSVIIVAPDGEEFLVDNITEFCKKHPKLSDNWSANATNLNSVRRGVRKSCRGFTIKNVA